MKYPKVIFRESDHSYWFGSGPLGSKDRKRLVSANQAWQTFCDPFDEDMVLSNNVMAEMVGGWRIYFAKTGSGMLKDMDKFNKIFKKYITSEFYENKIMLKGDWEYGNELGTEFHEMMEERAYSDGFIVNPFDGRKYETRKIAKSYDNQNIVEDLWDLEPGAYPELVIWNEDAGVVGQDDVVFIREEDGAKYVSSLDFKTNGGGSEAKGLKKRDKLKKIQSGSAQMSGPLSHIKDCTYTKYQGQMSMYMVMMENAGYIFERGGVSHHLNYSPDQRLIIEYPYLAKEAQLVLDHFAGKTA